MRSHKPLISIDIGGTIEDTWQAKRAWFALRGVELGPLPLSRRIVVGRIGVTEDLYREMIAAVYSDNQIMTHSAVPGSCEALTSIARRFDVIVLSSRPDSQREITLGWLAHNRFLDIISEAALIGHGRNKLVWCRHRGVAIHVDDDIRHLEGEGRGKSLITIHYNAGIPTQSASDAPILGASDWATVADFVAKVERLDYSVAQTRRYPLIEYR